MKEITVKIEKIVFGGKGLARHDGKVIFIEGVLPEEEVRIQIIKEQKNFAEAKVLQIAKPSPDRIAEPCTYISHCGGCQYQHIPYDKELRIKEEQVKELFTHHLNIDQNIISPIVANNSADYRYRTRVSLRGSKTPDKPSRLGYIAQDHSSSVVVDDCLLADEKLQSVFQDEFQIPRNAKRLTFNLDQSGIIKNNIKSRHYTVELLNKNITASSSGFFQVNRPITEQIIRQLSDWVNDISPFGFYDLFSGIGTFSLYAARKIPQLICVEEDASCEECLRINMTAHRENPWQFLPGRVEKKFIPHAKKVVAKEFMVFLDPPRSGLHPDLSKFFCNHDPFNSIAYLSCDVATLVRDLKQILKSDKYEIKSVIPYDMFPKTKHIETLVLLSSKSK